MKGKKTPQFLSLMFVLYMFWEILTEAKGDQEYTLQMNTE